MEVDDGRVFLELLLALLGVRCKLLNIYSYFFLLSLVFFLLVFGILRYGLCLGMVLFLRFLLLLNICLSFFLRRLLHGLISSRILQWILALLCETRMLLRSFLRFDFELLLGFLLGGLLLFFRMEFFLRVENRVRRR